MQVLAPEELVQWCQTTLPDDPRAFEHLVAQYKQRVFTIAFRLMGNVQDAEDQAQEAFLKIYRGIRQLDTPATLTKWIDRITINSCYDALSKQKRRPIDTPLTPIDDETPPHHIDTKGPLPEEVALQAELRRCIEVALAQLDAVSRTVLVLRDIEDRPYGEIVEVLGIGLSAAKMRIHRARLTFQQLINTVCPGVWHPTS